MPQWARMSSITERNPDEKTISRWSRSVAQLTNSRKPRRRPASRSTRSRTCSGVARTDANSSCIACSMLTSPDTTRGSMRFQRSLEPYAATIR